MANYNEKHLKLIYDNYHGNIEFSYLESLLLQSPLVNRLHQVLQNSTAYLVYPCCKTTRFEHSIGVMDYASKLFKNALSNSIVSKEYLHDKSGIVQDIFKEKINNLHLNIPGFGDGRENFIKNANKSFEININDIDSLLDSVNFRDLVINFLGEDFVKRNVWFSFSNLQLKVSNDYKSLDNYTIREEITLLFLHQALRLCGLFHDIGHLPFSHLFEFAIENVKFYLDSKTKRNKIENDVLNSIKEIINYSENQEYKDTTIPESENKNKTQKKSSGEIHEQIGKKIVGFIFKDIKEVLFKSGKEIDFINFIIVEFVEGVLNQLRQGYPNLKFDLYSLYEITNGIVDADRLDFVQRDGANSGISTSIGDIDRLIKLYNLAKIPENKYKEGYDNYIFLPAIQSIHEVEEILHNRYKVYKYLVNHHAVKRTDHILQHLIETRILKDIDEIDKSESKIATSGYIDFNIRHVYDAIKISHSVFTAKQDDEFKKVIYSFFQLTDFWLLSLLNRDFNQHLIDFHTDPSRETNIEKHKYYFLLSQIYENSRYYKSLWKRDYDFDNLAKGLGKHIFDNWENYGDSIPVFEEGHKEKPIYLSIISVIQCIKNIENDCQDEKECNLKCSCEVNIFLKICKKSICLSKHYNRLGRLVVDMLKSFHPKGEWCRTLEDKINTGSKDYWILAAQPKLKSGFSSEFEHIEGDSFLIIDNKTKNIEEFDQLSILRKSIESDIYKTITFFVYYRILNPHKNENDLEQKIIETTAEIFKNELILSRGKLEEMSNKII